MITQPYFIATITANGNLLVTADSEARDWIEEQQDSSHTSESSILWDGFEGYWNNGKFRPFGAGCGNPAVGISDALCIAEAIDMDDEGRYTINGRFWAFTDYESTSLIDELKTKGFVIFHAT